jgi:hypothetical protein
LLSKVLQSALRSRRLRPRGERDLEEWEMLRRLQDHPCDNFALMQTDEEIQLVTEYCPGGELFDAIQKKNRTQSMRRGRYSEAQAACITTEFCEHWKIYTRRMSYTETLSLKTSYWQNNDIGDSCQALRLWSLARSLFRKPSSDSLNSSDGEASPLTPGRSRAYPVFGIITLARKYATVRHTIQQWTFTL